MSKIGHNFPPEGEELPIPEDARPDRYWTEQMLEMADHIGAYRTLLFVDRFAGMRIFIPADWTRGKEYGTRGSIRDAVGDDAARILSDVYRRQHVLVPTAKAALARARRAPIIAAVRSGDITGREAAQRIGTSRTYLAHLVNQSDEGFDSAPPERRPTRIPGQLGLFDDD